MNESHSGSHSLTLSEYLGVLRRRKWLVLQAIVLVPLVAYLVSSARPALYEASAEVYLNRSNPAATVLGVPDPTAYQDPTRLAATHAQLARVPEVAGRAARASGVPGMTGSYVLGSSRVTPEVNTDLLRFSVVDRDPDTAVRLVNAYAREFTEYRAEVDTTAIAEARQQLTERIAEVAAAGDSDTELYQSLVDKEQQLRTFELLQTRHRVVRPASNAFQIAPTPVRHATLGLLAGILVALGLAFAAERLDKRVRSEEEIEDRLGLPLLARLPEPERRLRREHKLTMLAAPASVDAEEYRRLRTNLEFVNLERKARKILVTSAVDGEGKSTTAGNLAVACARAGDKVVLVDLDLRKPVLHKFFDVPERPGVTEVTLGRVGLEDALMTIPLRHAENVGQSNGNRRASGSGGLSVLTAGTLPPNPGEFVGTHAIGLLISTLAEDADLVVIDTPPLLAVGDAAILSSDVDGILLIARLETLRRPMLRELERIFAASPAPALGIAITAADRGASYGYGYAYGYAAERAGAAQKRAPAATEPRVRS